MPVALEIILIGCLVASAAAIPGCFLVLRKMSLMSDAISHSVLLGIVLMFFAIKTLHSPLLIIAATVTGLATVYLTEVLISSKQLKKDAAIGLIFPLFFAIAIVLINQFANNVHIDQDTVIIGEIAFTPFNRFIINSIDLGPIAMWIMGIIFILNATFVWFFYKELKICTFDSALATSLGFSPTIIHYLLMTSVCITTVGAFELVGTILIVALIITPPATAYLLTNRLSKMIIYSILIGCSSTIIGYFLAVIINGSISGSICTVTGIWFTAAFLLSKDHGVINKLYNHNRQKIRFGAILLTIQLLNHIGAENEQFESSLENLTLHMKWDETFAKKVISFAIHENYIIYQDKKYSLTNFGSEVARNAIRSS